MATFTSRLNLRMPDPTDLVSVTSDINASMSIIDAAVGFLSVTSFPAAPYAGRSVMVSTDSYRTYFNNGTAPASGGWVEILNSSGTFGSNVKLASAAQLVFGGDTNLFRNSASVLRTNDALIVDGALTASAGLTATTGGITVTAGGITVNGGLITTQLGGAKNSKKGGQTTVGTSTTETVVATYTIPANEPVAGALYHVVAWGIGSVASATTPQFSYAVRIGGLGGTRLAWTGLRSASSGISNHPWRIDCWVMCQTTGVSGTWFANGQFYDTVSVAGAAPITATNFMDGTAANTKDTTVSNDLVATVKWETSSPSNVFVCQGYSIERVA
jgi:hypothetical protein